MKFKVDDLQLVKQCFDTIQNWEFTSFGINFYYCLIFNNFLNFIEGGFAQVDSDVVSILTDKLIPMSDITSSAADAAMKEAMDLPTDTDATAREKAINRARVMSRVAGT